jgi:hypothetical protein
LPHIMAHIFAQNTQMSPIVRSVLYYSEVVAKPSKQRPQRHL